MPGNINDTEWAPVLTSSADSRLCSQIGRIETAENFDFNQEVTYYPFGPNSNRLANWLLWSGNVRRGNVGKYFIAPRKTTGWNVSLYGY